MNKIKKITVLLLCVLVCAWGLDSARGNEKVNAILFDNLGEHHHPITTKSELAQRYFNQGLILAYAFNHDEAERSFREAARQDPDCAMAYWGIAWVLGPNINSTMAPENVPIAYQALQKAIELGQGATDVERAYIHALSKRYIASPSTDRSSLDIAFAKAAKKVAEQFPKDPDAATIYAEAVMNTHPWNYWKSDGQPQAWTPEIIEALEFALKLNPTNPGSNHLYIHVVEASPNPEKAIASADILRDLVPGAGHLVHMPSHIYIRVGNYHEASLANQRAIHADDAYMSTVRVQGLYPLAYMPHNHHFLWATATMEGRSRLAIEAARNTAAGADEKKMRTEGFGTLQHYYTAPLYALVRFGKWTDILNEPRPAADLLYPIGVWHYARGMAFTRLNQVEKARAELERLKAIAVNPKLEMVTIWDINKTSDLLKIATEMLNGEIEAALGNYQTAVECMRKAARQEDKLPYDEPPPWHLPVRQALGAVLLEAGQAEEAQMVYQEDLMRFPENGWSLFGLFQSLEAREQTTTAVSVKRRFDIAWARADLKLTSSHF